MKYISYDTYKFDEGEPALRSCWECNGAHEHLKDVTSLHVCFGCGRFWIFGRYMDSFKDEKERDEFLRLHLEATQ